jgi:two-component sensor histidine kinase
MPVDRDDLTSRYMRAVAEAGRLAAELTALRQSYHLLMREANQRIANHLQLIAAGAARQRAKSDDPAVHAFADRMMAQVNAVGRVHAALAGRRSAPDFAAYITELCEDLSAVYASAKVRIDVEARPIQLDSEQFVPAGLITTELITNAQKHAFKASEGGIIAVCVTPMTPGTSILSVSDTGIGFPPAFRKCGGLHLVDALAQTMGGHVGFGPGSNVIVTLPNRRPAASGSMTSLWAAPP